MSSIPRTTFVYDWHGWVDVAGHGKVWAIGTVVPPVGAPYCRAKAMGDILAWLADQGATATPDAISIMLIPAPPTSTADASGGC
ncbi:hypothetical protein [Streptomyces justiciae]|uniref:hypothetical protein n=1 Tax=Streptomyces justiciae TaxID=2780140 RepID=UPI00187F1404|nr:hypothetical protein [Streptomyces justiciae]MBE8471635.1 hypothetical protein [Streptomyces justiciae]